MSYVRHLFFPGIVAALSGMGVITKAVEKNAPVDYALLGLGVFLCLCGIYAAHKAAKALDDKPWFSESAD
jgi:hypothetical protein